MLCGLTVPIYLTSTDSFTSYILLCVLTICLASYVCSVQSDNVSTHILGWLLCPSGKCADNVNIPNFEWLLCPSGKCADNVNVPNFEWLLCTSDDCVLTMSVHIALFHWGVCHRNTVLYYVNIHKFGWLMYLLHKDPMTVSEIWRSYNHHTTMHHITSCKATYVGFCLGNT